jgi:hypothetical protein
MIGELVSGKLAFCFTLFDSLLFKASLARVRVQHRLVGCVRCEWQGFKMRAAH